MQQLLETAIKQAAQDKSGDELVEFVQMLIAGVAEQVVENTDAEGLDVGRQAKAIVTAALKDALADDLGDDFDWSGLEGETLRPAPQQGDEIEVGGIKYQVRSQHVIDSGRVVLHCQRPNGRKFYGITHFANPKYREFSNPVSY